MILSLFVIFIASLYLVWQGTMEPALGFVVMAFSFGSIIWKKIRSLQERRHTRIKTRERKAKWGGELTVISGLSSFIGMPCDLYITRQDQLVVEDAISARIIPPAEVSRIGLFYGSAFDYLSDVDLAKALKFHTVPRFTHVRAWVRRNPTGRRRLILAIMFENPINELEYSEMAVFSDIDKKGNLDAFAIRPEVAVKLAILPKSGFRKRKGQHRSSTDIHTL